MVERYLSIIAKREKFTAHFCFKRTAEMATIADMFYNNLCMGNLKIKRSGQPEWKKISTWRNPFVVLGGLLYGEIHLLTCSENLY